MSILRVVQYVELGPDGSVIGQSIRNNDLISATVKPLSQEEMNRIVGSAKEFISEKNTNISEDGSQSE